jgi:transposase
MELTALLALPKGLEVGDITILEKVVTISLVSTQLHPCCPLCASQASHIHSRYRRHVVDLPCGGQEVRFVLLVRKFFCQRSTCARLIFVERLTPFIEPWARVTTRLFQMIQAIGLATGGMLGARLADRFRMETSWMTILRRMMALPTEPVKQVSQLGIDDFAFRRGCKYGTILVDMITHKVIDMLPDRTSSTSAAWMAAHPEIELVSRDRGGDYASAAREGAPQAIQCADRFHLLVRRIGAC